MRVRPIGQDDVTAVRKTGLATDGRLVLALKGRGEAVAFAAVDYGRTPCRAEVWGGDEHIDKLVNGVLRDAAVRRRRTVEFRIPGDRMVAAGNAFKEFGAVSRTEKPDSVIFSVDCSDY